MTSPLMWFILFVDDVGDLFVYNSSCSTTYSSAIFVSLSNVEMVSCNESRSHYRTLSKMDMTYFVVVGGCAFNGIRLTSKDRSSVVYDDNVQK